MIVASQSDRRRPRRIGALLLALTAEPVVGFVALVLGGVGIAGFSTMQMTLVLAATPRAMRVRVMGVVIVAIGTGAQVAAALDELDDLLDEPLLTVERAQLCKSGGELLTRPPALPATDTEGRPLWQKLMIHTSEATLHNGVPIHRAIVRRLLQSPTSRGATVLRGVWGYSGGREPHGDKLFQIGRQVPVTTIVVDTSDRIGAAFDTVDELTDGHGLISAEMVPAAVVVDGGVRYGSTDLARHHY